MAKVIISFKGVLDGTTHPRTWNVGDEIPEGTDLERVAVAQGWAKKKAPPDNKSIKDAPENKSASSHRARQSTKKTAKRSRKSAKK